MRSPATLTRFLLALALLSAAPAVAASKAANAPDPLAPGLNGLQRLEALLARIKEQQKQTKTLEARFRQLQDSSLLVAKEESTGTFSYRAPDHVRWEYVTPKPMSVVIRGEEMTTLYPDLKKAETQKVGRYSNQVFKYLGASGNLQTLLDYFTVNLSLPAKKGDSFKLELLPRYERIKKRLRSMTLWVDPEIYFPDRVRYVEANGDSTEYVFEGMKLNAPIPADRFVLKLPAGVTPRSREAGQGQGGVRQR